MAATYALLSIGDTCSPKQKPALPPHPPLLRPGKTTLVEKLIHLGKVSKRDPLPWVGVLSSSLWLLSAQRPRNEETPTHPNCLPVQDPGCLCLAQAQLQPHGARFDELLQDADAPARQAVLGSDRQTRPRAIFLLLFLSLSFVNVWNKTGNRIK